MARIRTVKPEFFSHEGLASTSAHARLLAIGLLTLADAKGRLRWVPMQVHAQVFPWEELGKQPGASPGSIRELLGELIDIGYVLPYEVDGREYIQIVNFEKHQRINGKEAQYKSQVPAPPKDAAELAAKNKGFPGEAMGKHLGASPGSSGAPKEHRNIGTEEQGKVNNMSAGRGREKSDYPDDFEKFWDAFPKRRRMKKPDALKAWKAALRKIDQALLMAKVREYAESPLGQSDYACMPSVFLRSEMWNDEPAAWQQSTGSKNGKSHGEKTLEAKW